jgi:DNA-binding transcriptional LysR family regulator
MDLLAALNVYGRAVDRRNFAAAARELRISQATVTRAVQMLEQYYGVELVRRSTREMVATEAGLRLHRGGAALLAASASLRAEVGGEDHAPPSGPLRVTAPSAFGVRVLAPVAAEFSARHSAITLELLLTDRYLDLVAENIDLAIRVGTLGDSRLIQQRLAQLPEVLVAAPDFLNKVNPPQHPLDLEGRAFVALSVLRDTRPSITLTAADDTAVTIQPYAALSFDTPLGVREALLAGAGIGRIHLYLVAGDLAAGHLRLVLPAWRCPTWPMTLVATARLRSRAAEVFARDLVAALRHMPGVETTRHPLTGAAR